MEEKGKFAENEGKLTIVATGDCGHVSDNVFKYKFTSKLTNK